MELRVSTVPDTSGICPEYLDKLPFGYIGGHPAASAVIYSTRGGPATTIDYHAPTSAPFPLHP